jgi:DNA-binding NarL/FixJ family response regulator
LCDGDSLRFGETLAVFREPELESEEIDVTAAAGESLEASSLSATQRKVLLALCRPYKGAGTFATPATNQQIADELYLSVDAIKTHLRILFQKFQIEGLPQNRKRAALVERAFQSGMVHEREL